MTLATRALFTGAFPYVPPSRFAEAITSAPDGGWTHVTEPKAFTHEGVVYFCFVDGDDGDVKVGTNDGTTTTLVTVGTAPEVDLHDAPSIIARADGRLVVAWSGHDAATISMRISDDPWDISSWGSTVSLDAALGGAAYTYCSLVLLGSTLYLFYRDWLSGTNTGRVCYSTSSDGGETWAEQTVLASQSGKVPYFVVDCDGSRIDIAVSTDQPANSTASIHHLYTTGSGWLAADGSSLGSPTFTVSSLPTVFSGLTGWPGSIVWPSISYMVDAGSEWEYRVADWDGSWSHATVAGVGRDDISLAVCSLSDDGGRLYGSRWNGSAMELWRWDRELAWAPFFVADGITPARIHGDSRILFLRGTYTTYLDNSLAVWLGR